MTARIAALIFIYVCTCIAWMILGGSVWQRTHDSSAGLRENVASIWGRPQTQIAPNAYYRKLVELPQSNEGDGATEARVEREADRRPRLESVPLPLQQSRVNVDLKLEHRRKGLVWYSTYGVAFSGAYRFENTSAEEQEVFVVFSLPDGRALYDGFSAKLNGREVGADVANSKLTVREKVPPGGTLELSAGYRSQGLDSWTYSLAKGASRVNDFLLVMNTNFDRIDFPDSGLSPGARRKTEGGWELRWEYASLLSGLNVAMAMPAKLQPGELVGRITFFAPVSLMFFFFLMFILTLLKNIDIHPMNYFFLAASFFAFHLLLAYTADLIDIHLAFLISSAVSIFLVVSYLRVVVGMRFALREAGLLQFLYLVGFSYTFFLEGYSALCVTIASIITLYIVMQLTAKMRWGELFQSKQRANTTAPPPAPGLGA
ncbi:MAG: inner membrane CreD family protein [Bryobacterales bacterium]|nr:inner membrane CreD family protein [Bryobacterales bacterium]